MLVFAAFDEESHAPLIETAKSYLAWKSIVDEKRQLNLDDNQAVQATGGRDKALQSVDALLREGYHRAAIPERTVYEEGGKWKLGEECLRSLDTSGGLGSMARSRGASGWCWGRRRAVWKRGRHWS